MRKIKVSLRTIQRKISSKVSTVRCYLEDKTLNNKVKMDSLQIKEVTIQPTL